MAQLDERMTDQWLLQQAYELRAEAYSLLHDEGLMPLIENVGKARVIGSYALDLMTWPDIDISMQLPDEKDVEPFFDIGREIVNRFDTARAFYSNHFLRDDQSLTHGLYWGIRLLYGGKNWKVDLWGYSKEMYRMHMEEFDELQRRLSSADRMAILRIKNEVCLRSTYRKEVTSMDVYRAVTECNLMTVQEFDRWLVEP